MLHNALSVLIHAVNWLKSHGVMCNILFYGFRKKPCRKLELCQNAGRITGKNTRRYLLSPQEEDRRQIWLKRIPRENLKITKHCGMCIKHFPEEQILRVIKVTRLDGKLEVALATIPNLKC